MAAEPSPTRAPARWGGIDGNELLTAGAAVLLTLLLLAEGVTLLRLGPLLVPHMFIGIALIPPVLLKLASTGYRFARYYTRSESYVTKGPPLLPLRLLAPVLVAATATVFVTGVLLLANGHRSARLLLVHKTSFIVWAAVFAVHFLAYLPRVGRSLLAGMGWGARAPVGGAAGRAALVVFALALGVAVAADVLRPIDRWHR